MTFTTRRETLALISATAGAALIDPARASNRRAAVAPQTLSLDYRPAPAGVDPRRPRFGWTLLALDPTKHNLSQTACQILVREGWTGGAVVYESGRTASRAMSFTPAGDLNLQPQTPYAWKVRVWDNEGIASAWSGAQLFTTAAAEAWRGQWIAAQPDGAITAPALENNPKPAPAYVVPLLRRAFQVDKPLRHAVLCLSGLGAYYLSLNGRPASPTLMNPGWTDYAKTVLYNTFDVTDLLQPGPNMLGVQLGGGMYDVQARTGRYSKWTGSFGAPKLLAQLRIVYADGEEAWIVTDDQWFAHPGPITYSSIYGGEDCDARLEPQDWGRPGAALTGWYPTLTTRGPDGVLKPQGTPGLTVAETFQTMSVTQPLPGVRVHDLGQNFSGRPVLTVRGAAGAVIKITPGELLDAKGRVTQTSMAADADNALRFTYTLANRPDIQVWRPRFSYSGFRFLEVEVEGEAEVVSVDGEFLHADLPSAGDFACSDNRLTRIHQLIRRAVLSNAVTILTDCPQREKLGWLEQTYLNAGTVFYNLQALPLYDKMAADIADAQLANGMVPSIAPEYVQFVDDHGNSTDFRDSPEWGSAVIQSPWAAYRFTGDINLLRRAYPKMRKYADYLASRSNDGFLNFGLGDWYDIGPGPPGEPKLSSKAFVGSATWYSDLIVLFKIASVLGRTDEATRYSSRAATLKDAINTEFFQPATALYDRGSQTAYAMALALDLAPKDFEAKVLANLLDAIHVRGDHVSAGDVGYHYVVQALVAHGRGDVLYAMATRPDPPSYAAQIASGATSLTEAWDSNPSASQNHFMLGHIESWLFGCLAGLDIDFSRGEADAIVIAPRPVSGVTWSRARYTSVMGPVIVSWSVKGDMIDLELEVAAGMTVRLELPDYGVCSMRVGSGNFKIKRHRLHRAELAAQMF